MQRIALSIVACLFALPAFAGVVDLSLTASISPGPPHRFGQTVQIALTITNRGPDTPSSSFPAPFSRTTAATTVRFDDDFRLPIAFKPTSGGCPFEAVDLDPGPGQRGGFIYVYYFPPLAPGQSHTCVATAVVGSTASVNVPLDWRVRSLGDSDPNLVDNAATVLVALAPTPVPALSALNSALLAVSTVLVAFLGRRRRRYAARMDARVDGRRLL